jgi:hypothetical protein
MAGAKQEKGRADEARRDEKSCENKTLEVAIAPVESGGLTNLAPDFIAHIVVNRGHVVLLAAMLFCLTQHVVLTGAFRFPGTSGKARVSAAE